MKIHLFQDDKFVDEFIELSSSLESRCVYYVLAKDKKPVYVTSRDAVIVDNYDFIPDLMSLPDNIICIHFLTTDIQRKILSVENELHCKILWFVWGADLYSRIPFNLYDEETEAIVQGLRVHTLSLNIKKRVGGLISRYKKHRRDKHLFKRIDYVCHYNEYDIQLVRESYKLNIECLPFFYADRLSFTKLDELRNTASCNHDEVGTVLVGNSGDPANNHYEVFMKIKNAPYEKIICPLSYGNYDYIKYIEAIGKKMFGKRFCPLLNFLSSKEYGALLSSVDVAVFAHNRSQAMSNIKSLLYMEKVVVIKSITTTYKYLLKNNVECVKYEEDWTRGVDIDIRRRKENRYAVKELFSENICKKQIANIYNIAETK